jgi:hypothetical protein
LITGILYFISQKTPTASRPIISALKQAVP